MASLTAEEAYKKTLESRTNFSFETKPKIIEIVIPAIDALIGKYISEGLFKVTITADLFSNENAIGFYEMNGPDSKIEKNFLQFTLPTKISDDLFALGFCITQIEAFYEKKGYTTSRSTTCKRSAQRSFSFDLSWSVPSTKKK